jgi:hypothetical protein
VAVADTEQSLAWEARQRPRAAIAAAVGAVGTLAADFLSNTALSDAPKASVSQSLQRAAQPGGVDGLPSLRTSFLQFYADHGSTLLLGSIARAIGFVGIAWALTFLAVAIRARRPEFPRAALYVGIIGGVLQAVSVLLGTIGSTIEVNRFLDGQRTVAAAADVGSGPTLVAASFIGLVGSLALALGFVLIALHAMRVGLLTRFMGILGIICGVLVIIPLGPLAIVQAFWLIALALVFVGRIPGGVPPAWETGEAIAWEGGRRGRDPEPAAEPEPAADDATAPARRKRKRRA